jgi:hypothetical protein
MVPHICITWSDHKLTLIFFLKYLAAHQIDTWWQLRKFVEEFKYTRIVATLKHSSLISSAIFLTVWDMKPWVHNIVATLLENCQGLSGPGLLWCIILTVVSRSFQCRDGKFMCYGVTSKVSLVVLSLKASLDGAPNLVAILARIELYVYLKGCIRPVAIVKLVQSYHSLSKMK